MNTPAMLARLQSVVALGTRAANALLLQGAKLPGFGFSETMAGTLNRPGAPPGQLVFHLRAQVPQLLAYLRDGRTDIDGDISVEGLAAAAPLKGSLWIWPLRSIIRYEFTFSATDGKSYLFVGQKDIRLLDFQRTITTLPAELKAESGETLGRAEVYFAMADLPAFVRSFHAVHGETAPTHLAETATTTA